MSELKLFLFGAPRLEQDGQAVPFNLRKGQALLAYLAETGRAQETVHAYAPPKRAGQPVRRGDGAPMPAEARGESGADSPRTDAAEAGKPIQGEFKVIDGRLLLQTQGGGTLLLVQ